jgi:hypothetical protein
VAAIASATLSVRAIAKHPEAGQSSTLTEPVA